MEEPDAYSGVGQVAPIPLTTCLLSRSTQKLATIENMVCADWSSRNTQAVAVKCSRLRPLKFRETVPTQPDTGNKNSESLMAIARFLMLEEECEC